MTTLVRYSSKLDLTGRILKFALFHHPVVQRSVILELQGTDGWVIFSITSSDGMGEIVHGVDAPLSPVLWWDMRAAVSPGAHVMLGRPCRSYYKHLCAVLVFPLLHPLEEL